MGQGAPPIAGAASPAAAALADAARRDATVAAALELPRQTPAQKLRTIITLIDLGRPEVAGLLVPELAGAPLDDAQRAALVAEFGTARFLKLIRLDAPASAGAPAGPLAGLRAFAQSCLDAADKAVHDPARLAALVNQLNAAGEEERYAARVDLRATGDAGIAAIYSALASATTEPARANLMAALADMHPAVDEPTIAVLAEGSGQVRRDAAELAGHLHRSAALPYLAAAAVSGDESIAAAARTALAKLGVPAPKAADAAQLVRRKLTELQQDSARTIDASAPFEWWTWNAAQRALTSSERSAGEVRTLKAARLARALTQAGRLAAPADAQLAAIYGLEEAALTGGQPSEAVRQIVTTMTAAELSAALAKAAAGRHTAAAIALTTEIGRRGDVSILATADGRPSPLAAALVSPVRELRFAALTAVMQLAPARAFPGSSHVAEALWYFAASAGKPAAVVAAPDIVRASDWAGQLRAAGFDATPARTGREALLEAIDATIAPRLAVVVLDSDIGEPLMGEVAYQIRTSERTSHTPILIASSAPRLEAARRIAVADPLVLAEPRPHAEGALAALVERTISLSDSPPASEEMRTQQAAQALGWIAKLLAEGSPYDELKRGARLAERTLLMAPLAGPSLQVLGAAGTADSQRALADYASAPSAPLEERRAAAAALTASVDRYGLQLTREQILEQYSRYNASETADADTQQVLSKILDILERK
jgi:hypothetical protein